MSTILIVDDAPAGREAIAKWLQKEGFETFTARNGAEGLVRLKETKPDLILLDHMMPEVDGLTFLAGIRRFPKWKTIPVIMMTGMKDSSHHRKAETLNVSAYLVKNEFTLPDLRKCIDKYLGSGQPAPAMAAPTPAPHPAI
ncbi:MAG TPA: response regulator [Tepidisphaeraceae bacterium]|jgi:chemosensory pili system protein ChpA (sensor histidine kinase/response regulator)